MTARRRVRHKSTRGTETARRKTFCAVAEGLFELRVGPRVLIDVLVTGEGELLAFLRVDGVLLGVLPVLGTA